MKIIIEKAGNHYRADIKEIPGSPYVGIGSTPEEAVANLFFHICNPTVRGSYLDLIDYETLSVEHLHEDNSVNEPEMVPVERQYLADTILVLQQRTPDESFLIMRLKLAWDRIACKKETK